MTESSCIKNIISLFCIFPSTDMHSIFNRRETIMSVVAGHLDAVGCTLFEETFPTILSIEKEVTEAEDI